MEGKVSAGLAMGDLADVGNIADLEIDGRWSMTPMDDTVAVYRHLTTVAQKPLITNYPPSK
jgi:hypothetical protein